MGNTGRGWAGEVRSTGISVWADDDADSCITGFGSDPVAHSCDADSGCVVHDVDKTVTAGVALIRVLAPVVTDGHDAVSTGEAADGGVSG